MCRGDGGGEVVDVTYRKDRLIPVVFVKFRLDPLCRLWISGHGRRLCRARSGSEIQAKQ